MLAPLDHVARRLIARAEGPAPMTSRNPALRASVAVRQLRRAAPRPPPVTDPAMQPASALNPLQTSPAARRVTGGSCVCWDVRLSSRLQAAFRLERRDACMISADLVAQALSLTSRSQVASSGRRLPFGSDAVRCSLKSYEREGSLRFAGFARGPNSESDSVEMTWNPQSRNIFAYECGVNHRRWVLSIRPLSARSHRPFKSIRISE